VNQVHKLLGDNSVRIALVIVGVVASFDISLRLLPYVDRQESSVLMRDVEVFYRVKPSSSWREWFDDVQSVRAAAVEKAMQAQIDMEARESAQAEEVAEVVPQEGDVRRITIGGLEFRLRGVFTVASEANGERNEVLAVLESDQAPSLRVDAVQVVGDYRVKGFNSRSVIFEAEGLDSIVTLWLFGAGPR